jgi:hypothetical protein
MVTGSSGQFIASPLWERLSRYVSQLSAMSLAASAWSRGHGSSALHFPAHEHLNHAPSDALPVGLPHRQARLAQVRSPLPHLVAGESHQVESLGVAVGGYGRVVLYLHHGRGKPRRRAPVCSSSSRDSPQPSTLMEKGIRVTERSKRTSERPYLLSAAGPSGPGPSALFRIATRRQRSSNTKDSPLGGCALLVRGVTIPSAHRGGDLHLYFLRPLMQGG